MEKKQLYDWKKRTDSVCDGLLQLKDLLRMGDIDKEFFARSVWDMYNDIEKIHSDIEKLLSSKRKR